MGVVSREAVESIPPAQRGVERVSAVMARDDGSSGLRVGLDEPLENLLGQEGLSRLGAIMAVDGEGVLRRGHDRRRAASAAGGGACVTPNPTRCSATALGSRNRRS